MTDGLPANGSTHRMHPSRRSSAARDGRASGTPRPRRPSSGTRPGRPSSRTRTRSRCASRAATCCEKGLGGVMFWEYHADRTGALLDTLDAALRGEDVVPLSGVWRFELDPADEGLVSSWENRTLADRIRLPGVLQAQGFGRRRHGRHAVDGADRRPVLLHRRRATSRTGSPATSRCRSGCSPTSTTSVPRGTSATWSSRRSGRAAASCSTSSGRTGRRSRGSTAGSSARATASRRPTSTTSARSSRGGTG